MGTAPACPRCGYDQSGAVAAWERALPPACPLEGTCPECGLGFEWRLVFRPELAPEARAFEHAQRRLMRAFIRTYWLALRPWALWRVVRLEQRVVAGRALLLGVAGGVIPALVALAGAGACGPAYDYVARNSQRPVFSSGVGYVGWNDVWRFDQMTDWTTRDLLGVGSWGAVRALFLVLIPLTFFLLPRTLSRCAVQKEHLLRAWAYSLPLVPLVLVLPLVLETAIGVFYLLDLWVHPRGPWMQGIGVWLHRHPKVLGVGALVLWAALWWGITVRRYLRLPNPWAVTCAMVVLALLGAVAVVAAIPGGGFGLMSEF